MRWKARKARPGPQEGDTRTIRKFLLCPRRLGGEWRWFEWATVRQCLRRVHTYAPDGISSTRLTWCDVAWADGAEPRPLYEPSQSYGSLIDTKAEAR